MTATTETVQILNGKDMVNVQGRIIAPGLAITLSTDREGWGSISHLPSGKAVIPARCPEHIEEAARLITGHTVAIDWTQPEQAIVGNQAIKDFIVSVNDAVGRCWDCDRPKYDGPTWSVRCTTCDWQWDDDLDSEGPLSFEEAREMARDHECEPNVELLHPGDDAKWMSEWRFKSDGTVA